MPRATHRLLLVVTACALAALPAAPRAQQPATSPSLLAERVDVSPDFRDFANNYYVADSVVQFDPATASGTLKWVRNNRYPRLAFNYIEGVLRPFEGVIFPEKEYDVDPVWLFSVQFVTPQIAVAQSTAFMDWSKLDVEVFAATATNATGLVALPDGALQPFSLTRRGPSFALASDPLAGKVTWTIHRRGEAARP